MSDVVLSAGVRQNLLSLQSTAHLMSVTQNRLATGKKVNTALDSPFNFFTSQALNHRAGDLNSLLDAIGQSQKTIEAADHGITAITKLVESARSIAKQAQQSSQPAQTYNLAIGGTGAVPAEDPATLTGSINALTGATLLNSLGIANGETITVSDGTNTVTHTVADAANEDIDDVLATLNGGGGAWTVGFTGTGELEITSSNAADTITVSGTGAAAVGFGAGNTTASPTNPVLGALSGTLTFQSGTDPVQTITFGAGNVTTRAELVTALSNLTGFTASLNGAGEIEIASTAATPVTIGGSDAAAFFDAANIGANNPAVTVASPSTTRANLELQYNEILSQIDGLARDASYNGINLLYGDNLRVVFNEDSSSMLEISGVTFTSQGLGLSGLLGDEFQTNGTIEQTLGALDNALATLRAQATNFGSKLGTVQTRQEFTKHLIQTLETGADSLVLADTNEEGANMLALQTRQQLSTTALSLSAQADQAVLRLFG